MAIGLKIIWIFPSDFIQEHTQIEYNSIFFKALYLKKNFC